MADAYEVGKKMGQAVGLSNSARMILSLVADSYMVMPDGRKVVSVTDLLNLVGRMTDESSGAATRLKDEVEANG